LPDPRVARGGGGGGGGGGWRKNRALVGRSRHRLAGLVDRGALPGAVHGPVLSVWTHGRPRARRALAIWDAVRVASPAARSVPFEPQSVAVRLMEEPHVSLDPSTLRPGRSVTAGAAGGTSSPRPSRPRRTRIRQRYAGETRPP
jgi:hypothetical protein